MSAVLLLLCGAAAHGATFRYSAASNRIYVEGGGTATLTDIKTALPNAPLYLVDSAAKVWLLRANLVIADGSVLALRGDAVGGDVNILRLVSNNNSSSNVVVSVDADWGTIDLNATRVVSWDEAASGPDTEYLTYGRAFIRARSRQATTGIQQSTLTVTNSDIGFLGSKDSETYGLTWQVVSSADGVRVFGAVSGSHIHNCQLGTSTWSVDDVSWSGTEIDHGTLYAFDISDAGHRGVVAANNVHDNDYAPVFRWSGASWRIYITGKGAATLSEVSAALPAAPLTLIDPANHVWLVAANLFIEKGAQLNLHGPASGGDVAELRLKSDNNTNANAFVEVRADFGSLDIRDTRITSWDRMANGPDREYQTMGRAFIRVRSSLANDGVTPLESRMDITNCDISFLGYDNSESYGLSWKVIGTNSTPHGIFDVVNVYGNIVGNHIHDNFWGVYSYGLEGGQWLNNEIDHNAGYGFDPHDDSDHLLIEGNNVHHNGGIARGTHGIIASRRCDHLVIRNNRSWANAENGIMVHRHSDDCVIENNVTYLNGDSGIALFDVDRTTVRNNVILSNANNGIRLTVGCADNVIVNNEIGYSGTNGISLAAGTDIPEPDPVDPTVSGRNRRNLVSGNYVHDCGAEGLKSTDADTNTFVGNVFERNSTKLSFFTSTGTQFISNSVPGDANVRLIGASGEPSTIVFKQQAQVNLQIADAYGTATFKDDAGAIFDFGTAAASTFAGPAGSVATVTSAELPNATTVFTRNLFVVPDAGSVQVALPAGNSFPAAVGSPKSWTAQATGGTTAIRYGVGDLLPDHNYGVTVTSASHPFGPFTADGQGFIHFQITSQDAPLTTSARYSVQETSATSTNSAPVLPAQPDHTVAEGTGLTVNNAATGNGPLTYRLVNPPAGAAINSSGVISWTPTEAQGPTTATFTTVATDGSSPPQSATNRFFVTVTEVNSAPTLPYQPDRRLGLLQSLEVHNAASDPDLPANGLTYQLTAAPDGATIDGNGTIRWTPPLLGLLPSSNRFTTVVTDNGSPALSAMNSFSVFVGVLAPPMLNIRLTDTNSVIVSWPANYADWQLQESDSLDAANWTDVNRPAILASSTTVIFGTNGVTTETRQEYEVTIWPLTDKQFFRLREE